MILDVQEALTQWRLIHLLGVSTLRARFARSKLGQVWLTLSIFINICVVGVVWSLIWHIPVAEYLPYIGIGQVIYLFASQTVNDSTNILVANARLYTSQRFPLSLSIFAHIYKNFIVFSYMLPIVIFLFFYFPHSTLNFDLYFPIGVLLTLLFLFASSYTLAIVCVRFRDMIQVIAVLMQSTFLVTPVMWNITMIPMRFRSLVYINPFAAILDIFRAPLLGGQTMELAYVSLLNWDIFFLCIAFLLHKKLAKNIVFWM